jgi:hypothetical protein
MRCRALGCNEPQCVLCQHNSQRRCAVNFCKKYLVNDRMVARCGAGIRVEVVDRATGKVYDGDLPDVFLEVRSLSGSSDSGAVQQKGKVDLEVRNRTSSWSASLDRSVVQQTAQIGRSGAPP